MMWRLSGCTPKTSNCFSIYTTDLLQIIHHDIILVIGIIMISIPFFLVPPELIFILKEQKIVYRRRMTFRSIPFNEISRVEAASGAIHIKDIENRTRLEIRENHFKNINLPDPSEYIKSVLSGNRNVNPTRYTSFKFKVFLQIYNSCT